MGIANNATFKGLTLERLGWGSKKYISQKGNYVVIRSECAFNINLYWTYDIVYKRKEEMGWNCLSKEYGCCSMNMRDLNGITSNNPIYHV